VAPGTVERESPGLATAGRVALVAHWSPATEQSRSMVRLVTELQHGGYEVVVSSTCESPGPLGLLVEDVDPGALTVLRRPNTGYDFGSWAAALDHYPGLRERDHVLMVNDSLVGPLGPLSRPLAHFESTTADVWGLVESDQFTSHLQSFFRGFRHGVLAEREMARFWQDLRVVPDKDQLIAEYEFGFTRFTRDHCYSTTAFVHHSAVVSDGLNPTIHGWQALLGAGVPFVKRELVRRPDLTPTGHLVPTVVAERFGVDVGEWT